MRRRPASSSAADSRQATALGLKADAVETRDRARQDGGREDPPRAHGVNRKGPGLRDDMEERSQRGGTGAEDLASDSCTLNPKQTLSAHPLELHRREKGDRRGVQLE